MSTLSREREGAVPSFATVADLRDGLSAKADFKNIDLYPRDGSEKLGDVEEVIAYLARVSTGHALAFSSGMAATTAAIEVALSDAGTEKPTLTRARELYSQSLRYVDQWLQGNRARVLTADSNSLNSLDRAFDRSDVIVTETIGNYLNVPVVDLGHLLELQREHPERTTIIDHTFPLSTGVPIGDLLTEEDRIIVVESGTKAYTFNQETLGVAYTKHPELLHSLKRYRRTVGSLLGVKSLQLVEDIIPGSLEEFDRRNKDIFSNTLLLAQYLEQALISAKAATDPENDPLDIHGTSINHPGLASHDDHILYQRDFPDGGVPAFYIYSQKFDQYELTERLWSHPEVKEHADLGQSFGFDQTRIVADENVRAVRIAGGAKIDAGALGKALAEALTN